MNKDTRQFGPLRVRELDAFVFRAPAHPYVQTSFGIMKDRPAVLLRATDDEGNCGWGEIWCNFPAVGAEHRARLALSCVRPLLCGEDWESPQAVAKALQARLAVLMIQTGERGPIHQVLAGLDVALWDLTARRAKLPLWRLLSGRFGAADAAPVRVYASGLNPTKPQKLAEEKLSEGYRAFKLKVGFGSALDDANLRAVREVIGAETPLMVDANQAWDLAEAVAAGRRMAHHGLQWMEEPMRADIELQAWIRLSREQPLCLAAGENLSSMPDFEACILEPEGLQVVQPDLGKWGGFTGCMQVGRMAISRGKMFCPHWLGGGVGLTASFHLKAAVGGTGYVEVDANSNPLRDVLARPSFRLVEGAVQLGEAPGLGVEPDLEAAREFMVQVSKVGL